MIGVLLVNLGTPEAPDAASVRTYLAEFLSDPRVIEIPQLLWQPILRGIVLRTRPAKSARAYQEVWTDEGSPLLAISLRQAAKLRERFGDEIIVGLAFRYGRKSIGDAISRMVDAGVDRILFAPLYPQFCAATTASSNDALFAQLETMRFQPAVRTLPPYFDDPLYIGALRSNLERQLGALDFEPQRLLLSFHGMPERTRQLGDPYYDQCLATARLLGEALGRDVDVAFQSRFGRAKWLEPATDATLAEYPGKGVQRLAIAAPGFSVDCLETIEELGIRGRDSFLAAGGTHFARLDCLNDSAEGMTMLERLVARELEGWRPAT
ncbi:ferrochelatase [Sphingomonas sp.]|uniref:ferrochelatase n=1 Tax=Sphingomonas sp. TaxID=28214 RepID=UPI0017908F47|nr:ferrochelatase [Sphingomonas sp.]MBA3510466.1 ferrochelatase [Sphingomonas sp.]